MVKIVYGDEPYLIDMQKRRALEGVTQPGINISMLRGTFTPDVRDLCITYPFLSERRAVILDCESLSELDNKDFSSYCQAPADATNLLIIVRNVDKRLKVYKSLQKAGFLCPCEKLKDENELRKVLVFEIQKVGGKIEKSALDEFVRRINYMGTDEMNLLTALSLLWGMLDIKKEIVLADVERFTPIYEEPDVFSLAKLISQGKAAEVYKQISLLSGEDAIGTLSLLLREIRIAYKVSLGFKQSDVVDRVFPLAFEGKSREYLYGGLMTLTEDIRGIKTGRFTDEVALKHAVAYLLPDVQKGVV